MIANSYCAHAFFFLTHCWSDRTMDTELSQRGARHIGQVVLLSSLSRVFLQMLWSFFPQHGNLLEVQWSLIEKELRQRQQMSSLVSSEVWVSSSVVSMVPVQQMGAVTSVAFALMLMVRVWWVQRGRPVEDASGTVGNERVRGGEIRLWLKKLFVIIHVLNIS